MSVVITVSEPDHQHDYEINIALPNDPTHCRQKKKGFPLFII